MIQEINPPTIVLELGEEGRCAATPPGFKKAFRGDSIGEAYELAYKAYLLTDASIPPQVKVPRWNRESVERTHFTANAVIELLRITDGGRRLDLSECDLSNIDLSPTALDALGVEPGLRWLGNCGIDLSRVNLEDVTLDGSNLQEAGLHGTRLQRASLRATDLRKAALWRADLRGAWLWETQLQEASLEEAQLQNATIFNSNLRGASLTRANLEGARLGGSLLDDATLYAADLRDADFRSVQSARHVGWTEARLDRTWLYRRDIKPIREEVNATTGVGTYSQAMETYLSLKTNFSQLGNYEDAAWAYLREQQMEKASHFPTTPGKRRMVRALRRVRESVPARWWSCSPRALRYRLRSAWLHLRLFLGLVPPGAQKAMAGELRRFRWARNWLYELLTGYGERPQMPVLWGAVTILAFTLVFAGAGNIPTGDPSLNPEPTHSFVAALTHSVASFATIGFNTLEPVGWGARLLTAVESMFGIGFFALFIYTLGNRMSRS